MSNNQIRGYISLLYSVADKPLDLWSKRISLGGRVHRMEDDMLHGDKVIEIIGPDDSSIPTSITVPANTLDVLNIRLPILVLIIKNLNLNFKMKIQVIDKKQYRRRFSFMTYNLEKLPIISASIARIPLKLEECWNFLKINLQTLCYELYGTDYEALQRIIIYPNCRLRRVYLQHCHYNNDETSIEMCQAFFDMYMLKWGINFVEKTCQTEECYTGFLKQYDLNFAKNNTITVPSTKSDQFKDVCSMGKLKNLNALDTTVNLCDFDTLKRNHMSLDVLNSKIKMHTNQNVTKQNQYYTKYLINDLIIENNCKESSNITEKKEKRSTVITYKMGKPNSSKNIKINNRTLQPVTSVQLKSIERSQFLKTLVDEMLLKDNKFLKRPFSHGILNSGDTYGTSKNCTLSNNNNNVQIEKSNVNVNSMDKKFEVSAANIPSTCISELSGNIKLNNKTSNNLIGIQNNELYIIPKNKHVKKNEKNIVKAENSVKIPSNAKENIEDIYIPPFIEKEAKTEEIKLRFMYLPIDRTDCMIARHFMNKRIFKKLQDKGFAVPQVELLIYNAARQRNFYGQEKFIKRQRWSIDKYTSFQ